MWGYGVALRCHHHAECRGIAHRDWCAECAVHAAQDELQEVFLQQRQHYLGLGVAESAVVFQQSCPVSSQHHPGKQCPYIWSALRSQVLARSAALQDVRAASDAGALGTTLHQLFQRSFAVAKEVRSSTEIGAHSISMTAAAVRLASQLFEDLRDIKVLFVGAGEMIELAATHFAAKTPKSMAIANRTLERGEKLASRFGAQVMRLADVPDRLHEFDAVISCTASTLPIIGLGAVERALKKRRHRPMFMVDLAVPRDIEVEVKALHDVYLYTVDDLASVVQTGKDHRQAAVAQAEAIIDAGVLSFMHWMDQRDPANGVVPLIQQINAQADEWRAAEMARARRLLAKGEPVEAVLEALSRGLTQKMLHGTLAELHSGDSATRAATAQTVSRLFLRDEPSKSPRNAQN